MIGVYDYTVVLTYMSLLSGALGIIVSLYGPGHPFMGVFFLMFSGLCDAFDGKVARLKKNRTEFQKKFGVQIDSLADLVAFGVLPACIGNSMLWRYPHISDRIPHMIKGDRKEGVFLIVLYTIMVLYILAALIRLAYYNVTEEERQKTEDSARKYFTGLPVTSASLIFPMVLLVQFLTVSDITPWYFAIMALVAMLFVSKIPFRKPDMKGLLILVAAGAVEFTILMVFWWFSKGL